MPRVLSTLRIRDSFPPWTLFSYALSRSLGAAAAAERGVLALQVSDRFHSPAGHTNSAARVGSIRQDRPAADKSNAKHEQCIGDVREQMRELSIGDVREQMKTNSSGLPENLPAPIFRHESTERESSDDDEPEPMPRSRAEPKSCMSGKSPSVAARRKLMQLGKEPSATK